MKRLPSSRILITFALLVLFFVFIVAILFITNLSFSVWQQLQQQSEWVIWGYAIGIIVVSAFFGRMIWRLLMPLSKTVQTSNVSKKESIRSIETTAQRFDEISQKISTQEHRASDLSSKETPSKKTMSDLGNIDEIDFKSSPELQLLQGELKDYAQRKSEKILYIALFGDISCGKSTVIKALISQTHDELKPSEEQTSNAYADSNKIETGVIGGTTREVVHYHWHLKNSLLGQNNFVQELVLTDMPGLNEQFVELDLLSIEEVQRAHIVIYLCDGDLTATQFSELKHILLLKKPCIVAMNKSDQYSSEERQLIIDRIKQRIQSIGKELISADTPIITISAGGVREFIRLTSDGVEERVQRAINPDLNKLQDQLQTLMKNTSIAQFEQLREKSVSNMMNDKLDDIEARFKHSQSKRLISGYTKKAVIASMATISPGTDLLVQGYLGIQMIKDLCKLYGVSATDIDANKLIELIQSRMDKTLPLLLAIAGNGLKAFPGIGTVSGGLMHAVAYGMIFDTLGRSVARTLEVTGELSPMLISDLYKEQLGENIESRTKDFIKLVLKLRNSD
ncbi:MAG: 50S ribosome-binding GTPase [Gammaproteobacteria bacterium]|nr:50S ribosome-binding GTPase [Gammaproteobacteria bacterium]